MKYRSLMAVLQPGRRNENVLDVTADLAGRFGAGVLGVVVSQPMDVGYAGKTDSESIAVDNRAMAETLNKAAEAAFRARLKGCVADLEWRAATTDHAPTTFIEETSRCADLAIVECGGNILPFDYPARFSLGEFVLNAGRPVLIVPPTVKELGLRHAMIGWKDTREARRAVHDALPLLRQARRTTIVALDESGDWVAASSGVQDVARWLRLHRVEAGSVVRPLTGNCGKALDTIAVEQEVDLVVAGAYGHSRIHEWALGGVTRDFLLNANRAMLLSH